MCNRTKSINRLKVLMIQDTVNTVLSLTNLCISVIHLVYNYISEDSIDTELSPIDHLGYLQRASDSKLFMGLGQY